MKKYVFILIMGLILLAITACGDNEMSNEEVYKEAVQASEDMESTKVTIDTEQILTPQEGSGPITTKSNINLKMTLAPFSFNMDGITSMDVEDLDGDPKFMPDVSIEAYVTDDATYISRNDMAQGWMTGDGKSLEGAVELAGGHPLPIEHLDLIKEKVDDFSLDHKDGTYTMSLDWEGDEEDALFRDFFVEELSDFIKGIDSSIGGDTGDLSERALDSIEFNDATVEFVMDDETFDVHSYKIDMDLDLDVMGEIMNQQGTIEMTYDDVNDVEPIEVPDDVKEEADGNKS